MTKRQKATQVRHEEWAALYDYGYNIYEIAHTYKVTGESVRKALKGRCRMRNHHAARPNYAPIMVSHEKELQMDENKAALTEGMEVYL